MVLRTYQVHLVSTGVSWQAFNQTICALRFFYGVTLSRPAMVERITYARKRQLLPVVLSAAEIAHDSLCRRPSRVGVGAAEDRHFGLRAED